VTFDCSRGFGRLERPFTFGQDGASAKLKSAVEKGLSKQD
jgi:hypothetical protein